MFPGQGSQSVGMLGDLASEFSEVGRTFNEASEALGFDLWELVANGPQEELNRTQNTQPAMLTAGVAVWRVWRACDGPSPAYMAGHSLGEYTALVCAEAFDFAEAVRLVADRGRFMQEAVPADQGGMAAILGLDDDTVCAICERAAQGEIVQAVNFNSPGQVVIGGAAAAVQRAAAEAKRAGAKRVIPLPMSAPSHCELMRPAAERLAQRLADVEIRRPVIRVLHNVHVQSESEPDAIRRVLVRQVESPVRWVSIIEKMLDAGVQQLLECGPGKVLTGLSKRMARSAQVLPVYDRETLRHALAATRAIAS